AYRCGRVHRATGGHSHPGDELDRTGWSKTHLAVMDFTSAAVAAGYGGGSGVAPAALAETFRDPLPCSSAHRSIHNPRAGRKAARAGARPPASDRRTGSSGFSGLLHVAGSAALRARHGCAPLVLVGGGRP